MNTTRIVAVVFVAVLYLGVIFLATVAVFHR